MSTNGVQFSSSWTTAAPFQYTASGEPKERPTQVTAGERVLYGDFAPVVRDLGAAVAAAQQGARTLATYVNEAREMPPVSSDHEPSWPAAERAFDLAAAALDAVAEAQRNMVRLALDEIEQRTTSSRTAPSATSCTPTTGATRGSRRPSGASPPTGTCAGGTRRTSGGPSW
jgi:hypothetical protein